MKHIGMENGLSNGYVIDLVSDKYGTLWAATEMGLNHIIGDNCIIYNTSNSKLSNNKLTKLYYDEYTNSLWIQSHIGYITLNCDTYKFCVPKIKFEEEEFSPVFVTSSKLGGVWMTDNNRNIILYNTKEAAIQQYYHNKSNEIDSQIKTMADDGRGHLYIGTTTSGFYILDIDTKEIIKHHKHDDDDTSSIRGNHVRTIFIDSFSNIWIGTNNGLCLYDTNNDCLIHFSTKEDVLGNNIMNIVEMSDQTLWVATDVGGISVLDLKTFSQTQPSASQWQHISTQNSKLSSNHIRVATEDKFNNIWIGNYCTGIDFVGSHTSLFSMLKVSNSDTYGIDFDSEDNLWVGGTSMLYKFSGDSLELAIDIRPHIGNRLAEIYTIFCDKQNRVWMGLNDTGALYYDICKNKICHVKLDNPDQDIRAFWEDSYGNIWIGTEKGINIFDCNGEIVIIDDIQQNINRTDIFRITSDEQDRYWIGTLGNGLFILSKDFKLLKHYTNTNFISENINDIIESQSGGMWIGTSDGLVLFPSISDLDHYKTFTKKEGIDNSHIRGLVKDKVGNIWCSTYSGISCFNTHNDKFTNYDFFDGLPWQGS